MPTQPPRFSFRPVRPRKPWARPEGAPDKRVRGRPGMQMRKRRLTRTNGLCERCLEQGMARQATIVNHKLALADGGDDVDENTENLCAAHDREATQAQIEARAARRRLEGR